MRGFSDRDNKDAIVEIEIMQVVTDAQHPPLAVYVTGECVFDGGVAERCSKYFTSGFAHPAELQLALRRDIGHMGIIEKPGPMFQTKVVLNKIQKLTTKALSRSYGTIRTTAFPPLTGATSGLASVPLSVQDWPLPFVIVKSIPLDGEAVPPIL